MIEKTSFLPALEVKKIVESPLVTKFIFQKLTPGLEITLGNTLRRLLKEHVPGWGIFAAKFADKDKTVASEWETLQGSKFLPSYLIFHLQGLAFKGKDYLDKKQIYVLKINIDNSQNEQVYQVTGKDVQGELEVINPEVYLTTIESGSQLKIDLYCRYFWGSVKREEQKFLLTEQEKENVIFLPTDYCPVKTVGLNYDEKNVISFYKEEKQLELVVTTDGSISGSDSLLTIGKFLEQIAFDIQQKIALLNKK